MSVGGIARILSSGGEGTALEGAPVLAAMVERAADRIAIMAGGGIRPNNLERVVRQSGVRQVHMSCRSSRDGPMVFRKASVPMGSTFGPSEFTRAAADEGTIRRVIDMLR